MELKGKVTVEFMTESASEERTGPNNLNPSKGLTRSYLLDHLMQFTIGSLVVLLLLGYIGWIVIKQQINAPRVVLSKGGNSTPAQISQFFPLRHFIARKTPERFSEPSSINNLPLHTNIEVAIPSSPIMEVRHHNPAPKPLAPAAELLTEKQNTSAKGASESLSSEQQYFHFPTSLHYKDTTTIIIGGKRVFIPTDFVCGVTEGINLSMEDLAHAVANNFEETKSAGVDRK